MELKRWSGREVKISAKRDDFAESEEVGAKMPSTEENDDRRHNGDKDGYETGTQVEPIWDAGNWRQESYQSKVPAPASMD